MSVAPLALDATGKSIVAALRRPASTRVLRQGCAETWHIFAVATPSKSALVFVETGFGNAHQLFARLRDVAVAGVHVALARLQVGRGMAVYLKLFAVYYDPDAGNDCASANDPAEAGGGPGNEGGAGGGGAEGPVSGRKFGLRDRAFAAFGSNVIPWAAYGPRDLSVNLFSDSVFRYGRMRADADAAGSVGPSVASLAQRGAVFERFTGRRRRCVNAAADPAAIVDGTNDGTAVAAAAAAASDAAAAPTAVLFAPLPDDGDDGMGEVPLQMYRPGRIDIAEPLRGEFLGQVACDHAVFVVDVSRPLLSHVRLIGRQELNAKLRMVLMDLLRVVADLRTRVNPRALVDIVWFHGDGYGSWQLDSDAWGEAGRDYPLLADFITSMQEAAHAAVAAANDSGDPASPRYTNSGCVAALLAAVRKRDVGAVHLVVDGAHAFDRTLPVAINNVLRDTGRCPPVHVVVIDPPHLKGFVAEATAEAPKGEVATATATAAARRQRVGGGSCGFLRNVCSLSGGEYSEVGGFEEPSRMEALAAYAADCLRPYIPAFLWGSR